MLFETNEEFSTVVLINGKRRTVKAPGIFTHMLLLAMVNIVSILPYPVHLCLEAGLLAFDTLSYIWVFMQATWYLLLGPNVGSSAWQRKRSSSKRFRVPRMHILASTFGAVCLAEERRRALNSGSSSTSLSDGSTDTIVCSSTTTRVQKAIKTPPDVLTPERSPTLGPLSAPGTNGNVFTYAQYGAATPTKPT